MSERPTGSSDDGPMILVPRIPGTALIAVIGGGLLLLTVLVVAVRWSRGEVLFPLDTDATDHTDAR